MITLSMLPLALNLIWAMAAFVLILALWKWVVDKYIILPGTNTMHLIEDGNIAAGIFAGLVLLGLCVMVGMVLG